ncbi:MAG TPA: hypothetical protein ENJ90_00445 [Devosia sp.]|nr:hypothetical protein [Devosia sp.]
MEKKSTKGVKHLYMNDQERLVNDPFNVLCDVGGSFNFDPRGGWTAIDVGFSPNELKKAELRTRVLLSPLVEIMAAWGLENARPKQITKGMYRYAVWGNALPPLLARAVLGCSMPPVSVLQRRFSFSLALSGKNKVICHAIEEK